LGESYRVSQNDQDTSTFEKIVVNDNGGEIRSQMNAIDLKDKITPGGSVDKSPRANVRLK
jgi:hypothetical protein